MPRYDVKFQDLSRPDEDVGADNIAVSPSGALGFTDDQGRLILVYNKTVWAEVERSEIE